MEGIDNAEKLCFIAAVLKSFIRSYDWGTPDHTSDPEEIQCMTFAGKEVIYISGNKDEHKKILELLNAYGVATTKDLMDLISLSHGLASLNYKDKTNANLNTFKHKYSPPENDVVLNQSYKPTLSNISTQLSGISTMLGDAKTYLKIKNANKKNQKNITEALTKFKKSHSDKKVLFLCKLVGITPPEDYQTIPPILSATSTPVSTVHSGFTVHVIENNKKVHAELALLNFFTAGVLDGTFSDVSTVYVGGLKTACQHCKSWINNYKILFKAGSGLSLEEASDGTRAQRQHNDGHCPTLVATPSTKLATNSSLFRMLFGGAAINGLNWNSVNATEPTSTLTD
ncbi:hypothetical protein ABGV49_16690 [Chromobacterium vaccinii]|uniref:Uncharacterized protein n=1 Tax=Chromobacterium vaccinii TaxID=1108595 RepID=A0ABV0FF45_9NEIS